jgi:hypothetical protein
MTNHRINVNAAQSRSKTLRTQKEEGTPTVETASRGDPPAGRREINSHAGTRREE